MKLFSKKKIKIAISDIEGKGFIKFIIFWNSIKANKVKIKIIVAKKNSDTTREKIIRKAYKTPEKILVNNSFIFTKILKK